ncbi:sensor histidine kinase [Dactylosporangium sp. AC04546]|uniref:sensor histidine kinase n=1 Tax=Dactylosporangium sp. AC04546 TaxID=2862460 RepID=UPI001EDD33D0|nr:sensor histidine kinase [Dactylosporangium sp. AC04546]WVK87560.1 sensor histidine kinase [Dactylosporangium sp. AC04546]
MSAVSAVSAVSFAWWRQARSLVFLVLLTAAMLHDGPRGPLAVTLVGVAGVAWLLMTLDVGGTQPYGIGVCTLAGLWLCWLAPGGFAPCYLIAAVTVAAAALTPAAAAVATGATAAALAGVLALAGETATSILAWSGALALILLLGMVRRQRADQAAQQRELDVLAERARLAREIHDVLAHSLSALSVQLETAAALLEKDRPADAAVLVDRAGRLARDGLTETRRAVGALRGDPVPLPDLVGELVAGYRTDLGAPATFTVGGDPRPLPAEAGLALFRGAQEALTNVRKHAPGSPLEVRLEYGPAATRLSVRNGGGAGPPVTGLPPGYGLTGLRERAELAGGTVAAGPSGGGWLVDVRMPG